MRPFFTLYPEVDKPAAIVLEDVSKNHHENLALLSVEDYQGANTDVLLRHDDLLLLATALDNLAWELGADDDNLDANGIITDLGEWSAGGPGSNKYQTPLEIVRAQVRARFAHFFARRAD